MNRKMKFVKVFCGKEIVDLNISLILKVEKCKEGFTFERAIITDVLGNKYRSLSSYDDFIIMVSE
jgi:hypothetical protein